MAVGRRAGRRSCAWCAGQPASITRTGRRDNGPLSLPPRSGLGHGPLQTPFCPSRGVSAQNQNTLEKQKEEPLACGLGRHVGRPQSSTPCGTRPPTLCGEQGRRHSRLFQCYYLVKNAMIATPFGSLCPSVRTALLTSSDVRLLAAPSPQLESG